MDRKRLRKAWHLFSFGNLPYILMQPFLYDAYETCGGITIPYVCTCIIAFIICIFFTYIGVLIEERREEDAE